MSYDISLVNPVTKKTLEVDAEHFITGGTFAIGGTKELWLNVTYNYCDIFKRVMGPEGIYVIENKTGAESISILTDAINKLSDETDPNYWKATEGNAKQSLYGLLAFAKMRPDGVFTIT